MEHITKRTPSEYEVLWEQEIRTTINTGCSTATSSFIMTIDSILHVCQFAKHVIMYVELRFYFFSFFFFKKIIYRNTPLLAYELMQLVRPMMMAEISSNSILAQPLPRDGIMWSSFGSKRLIPNRIEIRASTLGGEDPISSTKGVKSRENRAIAHKGRDETTEVEFLQDEQVVEMQEEAMVRKKKKEKQETTKGEKVEKEKKSKAIRGQEKEEKKKNEGEGEGEQEYAEEPGEMEEQQEEEEEEDDEEDEEEEEDEGDEEEEEDEDEVGTEHGEEEENRERWEEGDEEEKEQKEDEQEEEEGSSHPCSDSSASKSHSSRSVISCQLDRNVTNTIAPIWEFARNKDDFSMFCARYEGK